MPGRLPSESAVTNVDLVVAEFQRPFRLENKHLSEVLAYYAVKSPALTSFLKTIWAGCSDLAKLGQGTEDTVMQLQDAIARAIIGLVIDNKIPLLHELISGPFDADKLDYYARDNHLAGTPSALDISRLIQKITVRPFTREDLPPRIAQSVKTGLHSYWLFGIKWSGLAVLDELHLTRVLLYSKIYHHAKVIAVERMIQSFAAELAQVVPAADLLRFFYDLADDTILHLSTEELQRKFELKEPLSQEQREHLTCASGILRSIRDRRLVVKAFQLHGRYPDDAEGDSRSREGLAEMAADLRSPIRAPQLIDKVLKDIELLLEKLSAEGPGRRDIRQLRREVLFHMQKPEAGGAQINRAFLMPSMGKPVPFKAGVVNKHGWVSSYFSDHPEVAGLVETAFRR
jgi:HD superfamily phosphohydrolase